MERITLAPGAHINVLPAEKFNRCRISINFIWPAAREWATAEALLPLVLERGYSILRFPMILLTIWLR